MEDVEVSEAEMWRARAEAAEASLYDGAVRRGLEGVAFSSGAARRYVEERIREAGLTMQDGELCGLGELLDGIRDEDPGVFAGAGRVRFTDAISVPEEAGGAKKARIMAIRDREARHAAIAANLELFL